MKVLKVGGFPGGLDSKESVCQCRRSGFDPWDGKIPREGNTQSGILAWRSSWTEESGRL